MALDPLTMLTLSARLWSGLDQPLITVVATDTERRPPRAGQAEARAPWVSR